MPSETNLDSSADAPVLIAGAGPSGLLLALQLAQQGVQTILIERNLDTTKWPKMDVTNCRSMELFNRLGISKGLRDLGVGQDYSFDVLFSSGLSKGGQLISKWDLDSPNRWRERTALHNDGSMPREPYQRCSQAVFEAWLKKRIQAEPLIDSRFGWKLETFTETDCGVQSTLANAETGETRVVHSQYLAGCDGAGSRVRKTLKSELVGGPVPMAMFLIHFKSRDLTKLHKQGQFWHIFFTSGGVLISQDEVNTWTAHLPISLDTDWKSLDPKESVYKVLGGSHDPFPITIDEVLVSSAWRPSIATARRYSSDGLRVFLVGDAAHQNIPTGGYGMNTAVGDSFDLGWKLTALVKGWGGSGLLSSYELERKPVAVRNIERSGVHHKVHLDYVGWVAEASPGMLSASTDEGLALRERIKAHTLAHDGENVDHGIEMGYRYSGSPIVLEDGDKVEDEPEWHHRRYIPSTWPGARAPHVYLGDNKTSIFDLFGPGFTLIDFTSDGGWATEFEAVSLQLSIPLKAVHLPQEHHTRKVWGRDAVLIRPDDHVAWRSSASVDQVDIGHVLKVVTGQVMSKTNESKDCDAVLESVTKKGFTGTVGNVSQGNVQQLAEFQV